mgnify:CR=1 FL=1
MLTYDLDRRGTIPRYDYLCRCIRDDILCGRLTAGSRLPSRRSLAEHLKVSAVTVESAYAQLAAEGYIVSREKSGYFVSQLEPALRPPSPPPHPDRCSAPGAALDDGSAGRRREHRALSLLCLGQADAAGTVPAWSRSPASRAPQRGP